MRTTTFWLAAGVCGALGLGCGGAAAPTTSTLTGTIAQETFPSRVDKITVVSAQGATSTVAVSSSGAFKLTLGQGTYRFLLSPDGKSTPLVIKSDAGRLQTEVTITSGGASADIGKVRFWAGSAGRRHTQLVAATTTVVTTPAACVSGFMQGTKQPCASGNAAALCADEDGDSDEGEHHGGGDCPNMGNHDGHDGPGDRGDQGDQADDAAPAGAAGANDASARQAIGVPELNLPVSLGCEEEGDHDHHHGHHGDHDG